MRIFFISVTAIVFTFVGSMVQAPTADADWSDNFNGGTQQFWQFGDPDGNAGFSGGVVNDRLVLTNPTAPINGGSTTGFGVVITETFTDVRMTGLINPDNNGDINDTVGLLFRGNLVNQSFYMAEINYTDQQLIIFRNGGGPNGGNLVIEPIPGLQFTDSLYVEVEAVGDFIEAWVYDMPGGNLRATTSVTDTAPLASGLSGVLVNENFSTIPMLGIWDDITAEVITPAIQPDLNGDGIVDMADYTVWRNSLGATGIPAFDDGDANGDGNVNVDDYNIWRDNFGQTAALSAVAVPEPCTGLICALAVSGLGVWRRWGIS